MERKARSLMAACLVIVIILVLLTSKNDSGASATTVGTCSDEERARLNCDINAECLVVLSGVVPVPECQCNKGYTGSGKQDGCYLITASAVCPLLNVTKWNSEFIDGVSRTFTEGDEIRYKCVSGYSRANGERGPFIAECRPSKLWYKDPENCSKDVNECVDGTHKCSSTAICINTNGSHVCQCSIGMVPETVNGTVNCRSTTSNCSSLTTNNGQWKYTPSLGKLNGVVRGGTMANLLCNVGYVLKSGIKATATCGTGDWPSNSVLFCDDDNECSSINRACEQLRGSKCINTQGSFLCECPPGTEEAGGDCRSTTSAAASSPSLASTTPANVSSISVTDTRSVETSSISGNKKSSGGDKTFILVAAVIGTVLVISLILVIVYLIRRISRQTRFLSDGDGGQVGTAPPISNVNYEDPHNIPIQKPAPPDYANAVRALKNTPKNTNVNGQVHSNNLTGFPYPMTMETTVSEADNCSHASLSGILDRGPAIQAANRQRFGSEVNAYSTKQLVFPSLSAPPSVRAPPPPTENTSRYHNNQVERFHASQQSLIDTPPRETARQGGQEESSVCAEAVEASSINPHKKLRRELMPYEIPVDPSSSDI